MDMGKRLSRVSAVRWLAHSGRHGPDTTTETCKL